MKSIIAILGIAMVFLTGAVMAEKPIYTDFPHYPAVPENISAEKPIYTDFPHYYADATLWDGIPVISMITCLDSRAVIGKSTVLGTNITSLIVSMRDRLYQTGEPF